MKFTFNIILLLITLSCLAQEEPPQEEAEKQFIYDIKIGFNAIRAGQSFIGSGNDSHEGQLMIGFKSLDFAFDYGWENNDQSSDFTYLNNGTYFRLGIDRNFIKDRASGNNLSLGLRYARANFRDELSYSIDNGFGPQDILLVNPDLQARWFELVFNLRGKVVSNLYTGFTLRWKFGRLVTGEEDLQTFEIPGFGNTKRQNATAFDYYLMWRIPFD